MIIDTHTHIFPDKIADRTLEILSGNAKRVGKRDAIPQTNGKLDGIKKSMAEHGVNATVVLPIATTVKQSHTINTFAAQINGVDNVYSLGSLHPMQEDWESALFEVKEFGLSGIKLHPEYQGFFVNSPQSIRVLKKCEELDLVVYFHAGKDIGIEPPLHSNPKMFKDLLNHISGKNIILAHMGSWQCWDEVEEFLIGTPYYFDTSYSLSEMSNEQIMRIIKNHGRKKILFGTDSPWENPSTTISIINSLPLLEEEKDNIFYKNAIELFKMIGE